MTRKPITRDDTIVEIAGLAIFALIVWGYVALMWGLSGAGLMALMVLGVVPTCLVHFTAWVFGRPRFIFKKRWVAGD